MKRNKRLILWRRQDFGKINLISGELAVAEIALLGIPVSEPVFPCRSTIQWFD